MSRETYIGHDSQLFGVEEHRLTGGKGDGMRLFEIRNGHGLRFTVSADRCADISRLSYKDDNYGFFSAGGYTGPQYYDDQSDGFLKSFTAGFLTTCGLTAAGAPCTDEGQKLPLHGTIGNCPAESVSASVVGDEIVIAARVNQARIFSDKLVLDRRIACSLVSNEICITDIVSNFGSETSPLMLLYHFNMGYPLLDENAELFVPSVSVSPRNERAAENIDSWNRILSPSPGFVEQCYYHRFAATGFASIFNHSLGKGLTMSFDAMQLDCFTEWKMMGVRDYVLGLEPGNCLPDGRDVMREKGLLKFIRPGEKKSFEVRLKIIEGVTDWENLKKQNRPE